MISIRMMRATGIVRVSMFLPVLMSMMTAASNGSTSNGLNHQIAADKQHQQSADPLQSGGDRFFVMVVAREQMMSQMNGECDREQ